MTFILSKLTGTENLTINIIASIGLTFVICLVTLFTILAVQNGIKTF